jgi:hypothetical protein
MGHDAIAVSRECLQDAVLERSRAHIPSVPVMRNTPAEVDRNVAKLELAHRQVTAHVTPYACPCACEEFGWAEWLDDLVIGVVLECREALRFGRACGQHDDRHRRNSH